MSLLDQLIVKRNLLKPTQTIVTHCDGRRHLESRDCATVEIAKQPFGFVVDTRPDNIPVLIKGHLLLGSQDCCEPAALQNFNIRFVLSVGVAPPCVFPNVVYKFVECLDLPETNIAAVVQDECVDFLNKAIEQHCNVLVHCNAGVSRSPAVVLGYLMLTDGLTFDEAYSLVKSKRGCIKPNQGFEKQLRSWILGKSAL